MTVEDLTPGECKLLEAAREYAAALAVLRGNPPFTADDVLRIFTTREMVLNAAAALGFVRETSPSRSRAKTAPQLSALIRGRDLT